MKRTELEQGTSRWKKTGGGSLRIKISGKKRIIKPGEVFTAKEHEIPAGFRDVIIPLDTEVKIIPVPVPVPAPAKEVKEEVVAEVPEAPVEPTVLVYSIQARSGGGYFDVVDKDGKVQNDKAMREAPAKELLKALMG